MTLEINDIDLCQYVCKLKELYLLSQEEKEQNKVGIPMYSTLLLLLKKI